MEKIAQVTWPSGHTGLLIPPFQEQQSLTLRSNFSGESLKLTSTYICVCYFDCNFGNEFRDRRARKNYLISKWGALQCGKRHRARVIQRLRDVLVKQTASKCKTNIEFFYISAHLFPGRRNCKTKLNSTVKLSWLRCLVRPYPALGWDSFVQPVSGTQCRSNSLLRFCARWITRSYKVHVFYKIASR